MSNSIAPGSSADVNVKVTALTTNPNVPVTYKTIILKKNLVNGVNTLTQAMMNQTNTKYVIKYDYVLGEDIYVPNDCILEFDGGSISGAYTIIGNDTQIKAQDVVIFKNGIIIAGSWICPRIVSSWFNDATSTNRLQQLINLSNDNVDNHIIINPGNYSVDDTYDSEYDGCLKVKSNTVLEVNGIITLEPNPNKYYRVLLIYQKQNVTVFGKGSLVGDRDTHTGTSEASEWGHVIAIWDSKDIIVRGISASYAWGDNICIADNSERVYIQNCEIFEGGRQGITIGDCNNIIIENCYIHDITRTAPFACIDIEPDYDEWASEIIIRNNIFENSGKQCIQCGGMGSAKNVLIHSNTIRNAYEGIQLVGEVNNINIIGNNINVTGHAIWGTELSASNFPQHITVRDNIISSNDYAIHAVFSSYLNIINNTITGTVLVDELAVSPNNIVFNNNHIEGMVNIAYGYNSKFINNYVSASRHIIRATIIAKNEIHQNYETEINGDMIEDNIIHSSLSEGNHYIFIFNGNCRLVNNIFYTENDYNLYALFFVRGEYTQTLINNKFIFNDGARVSSSVGVPFEGYNNELDRTKIPTLGSNNSNFLIAPASGSNRPTLLSDEKGKQFFDTTLGKPIYWTGTAWVDALGNSVSTIYPKVIGTPTSGNLAKFNNKDIEDAGIAPTSQS